MAGTHLRRPDWQILSEHVGGVGPPGSEEAREAIRRAVETMQTTLVKWNRTTKPKEKTNAAEERPVDD